MSAGFRFLLTRFLGRAGKATIIPPVATDIRSGHLNIDAGRLEFVSISGSENLEIKGPRFELVITS